MGLYARHYAVRWGRIVPSSLSNTAVLRPNPHTRTTLAAEVQRPRVLQLKELTGRAERCLPAYIVRLHRNTHRRRSRAIASLSKCCRYCMRLLELERGKYTKTIGYGDDALTMI